MAKSLLSWGLSSTGGHQGSSNNGTDLICAQATTIVQAPSHPSSDLRLNPYCGMAVRRRDPSCRRLSTPARLPFLSLALVRDEGKSVSAGLSPPLSAFGLFREGCSCCENSQATTPSHSLGNSKSEKSSVPCLSWYTEKDVQDASVLEKWAANHSQILLLPGSNRHSPRSSL